MCIPVVVRMAQMSLHDELLNLQQETITSFIELLEKDISQNSQWVQRLIEQCSCGLPKSILGKVEELIEREKQNTSKLQVLEELQREATEIAEEQHYRPEEARLNLTTPLTSEAENYGGQGSRPSQGPNQHLLSPALCFRRSWHQHIIAIPDYGGNSCLKIMLPY